VRDEPTASIRYLQDYRERLPGPAGFRDGCDPTPYALRMTIMLGPRGQRSVTVEIDVIGTPEEVWAAIATSAGVSSWFVDTIFENEGDGAPLRFRNNFGPGMESVSEISSWNPPRVFTAESQDLGPDAPPVLTTWTAEPNTAGGCTVRVTHSVHTDKPDWDAPLSAWESGWPAFFHLLQLKLEHFRGEPSASCSFSATAQDAEAAWKALATGLGIVDVEVGANFAAPDTAPALAGCVERAAEPRERVLRLAQPAPAVVHTFVMPTGKNAAVWMRFNFFGESAAAAADAARSAWQAWFADQFPANPSAAESH